MQAVLLKVSPSADYSIVARTDQLPYLYDKWHFHPEIELTHIVSSSGTRFVGDSIEEFKDGDLILLGSNLPHVWKNDAPYFQPGSSLEVRAHVIQFLPDCFGKEFLSLREMEKIRKLFEKAQRGLRITGKTNVEVAQLMERLIESSNGAERMILFINIFDKIAESSGSCFFEQRRFFRCLSPLQYRYY